MENFTIKLKKIVCLLGFLIVLNIFSLNLVFGADMIFSGEVLGYCSNFTTLTATITEQDNPSNVYDIKSLEITYSNETRGIFALQISGLPINMPITYNLSVNSSICNISGYITGNDVVPHPLPKTISDLTIRNEIHLLIFNPEDDIKVDTNRTFFNWDFNFYDSYYSELVIASNSDLSSIVHSISPINLNNYTLSNLEELADATYYWKIFIYTQADKLITSSDIKSFYVSEHGLQINSFNPSNTTWNKDSSVLLSFNTDGNGECRYSNVSNTNFESMSHFDVTDGTTHNVELDLLNSTENNFYFRCNRTSDGVISNEFKHLLLLDNKAPNISSAVVTINGSTYSTIPDINFSWHGFFDTSPGSGIAGYYYNTQNLERSTIGTYTTSQFGSISGLSESLVNVYVWSIDNAGNIGSSVSDSIIIDLNPPIITEVSRTNLNLFSTGDFTITIDVSDISPFSIPRIRYKKWTNSWSSYTDMTSVSSTRYRFTIPNSEGNDSWNSNGGESLYLNITVTDVHNRQTNFSAVELIDLTSSVPVLDPIPDLGSIAENETLKFNITGSDLDGDSLTYGCFYLENFSCSDLGISISKINNNLATVTWSPKNNHVGVFTVSFYVSDQVNNVSRSTTLEIINVNDPPVFGTNIQDVYDAYVYEKFNLTINATDPDGDVLTFKTNHSLISIGMYSGEILLYPSYELRGEHDLNITITDPSGETIFKNIKLRVGYCGDGVCNAGESESLCAVDCLKETTTSSTAIILYPRNCLESNITVKVVELVPRGSCQKQGVIIDNQEVCDGLSEKEVVFEEIVDNSFEVISTHITNKDGFVTFIPKIEGVYRISLKNSDIKEVFTSKECIVYTKNESLDVKIITPDSGSFDSTVERPSEIIKSSGEGKGLTFSTFILIFLIIPILFSLVTYFGAQKYYFFEIRQIKTGKKTYSKFVSFIDEKIITNYLIYKKKVYYSIKDNEFLMYYLQLFFKSYKEFRKELRFYKNNLILKLKKLGIIGSSKTVLLKIPFIKSQDTQEHKYILLTLLSANKYVHKYLTNYKIYEKLLLGFKKSKDYHLAYLGKLCMNLNNAVTYYENERYQNDHDGLKLIKSAHKAGVLYKSFEWDITEFRKIIQKKRSLIVELISTDINDSNKFSSNLVLIEGYDPRNIIVHDYKSNIEKRKIKNELFMVAWKNANYRMLKIEFGKKKFKFF
jgi:hypothetical protein